MQHRFSAVAFDMDGLMFNTEDLYWKSGVLTMQRRGREYTLEIFNDVMGRPPKYCFEKMIEYYDLDETWESLREESENTFLEVLGEGFDMMPGLLELLEFIEQKQLPKSVCTSSSRRVAEEVLGRSGLRDRFDFVLAFEDIVHGKPDPEIYLKAASRFQVPPGNMLVLEDSVSGCHAARNAGAFVVAVLAEHNREFDLSHASLIAPQLDAPEVMQLLCE